MAAKETAAERDARLKAALRDNLKRRKQAARKAKDSERSVDTGGDEDGR
ncbi:hypothetical protein [Henriciella barbarensis]|nr:hypothetical protein [Henriciella barbarensis]